MESTTTQVSQKEYLKRYLMSTNTHNDKSKKKKRLKIGVKVKKSSGIRIIDNYLDVIPNNAEEIEDEVGEDAPIIADIVDERPKLAQIKELYETSRWKKIGDQQAKDNTESTLNSWNLKKDIHEAHTQSHEKHFNSDSDNSLPRNDSSSRFTTVPKPHKKRHDSDSSGSPVCSQRMPSPSLNENSNYSSAIKSAERRTRHDSDCDLSPRRHGSRHDSDRDLSPPRHFSNLSNNNIEIPGKNTIVEKDSKFSLKKQDSDSDLSPERMNSVSQKDHNRDIDFSPPRKQHSNKSYPSSRHGDLKSGKSAGKHRDEKNRPTSTLSGLKAGLQMASALREEEHSRRKQEVEVIQKMSKDKSGENADTVYRDRATGKKRNLKAEQQKKDEEEKKLAAKQAKYAEWGKGIEQKEQQAKRFEADAREMSKPLARYKDDEDLDQTLKEQDREGDPMLAYIRKKKQKDQKDIKSLPTYSGPPAPPNRFNIQPGYRWDGVDRSNGFEGRYFEKLSSKKSKETESHLWSVQEM